MSSAAKPLREKSPAEQLNTPVQYLKGVGPERAELLAKLDLHYARDLLFFFPRAYQDMSELRDIDRLEEGKLASVCGVVEEVDLRNTGIGKSLLGVLIRQETKYLRLLYFNQPWRRQTFNPGQRVLVSGEPKLQGLRWEMAHPTVEFLAPDEDAPAGRILPVYSLTEGLNQPTMRRIVQGVAESHTQFVDEVFPDELLDAHKLWPIRAALPQVHSPENQASLAEARRRFIYQEFFILQLALAMKKWLSENRQSAPPLPVDARIDARITRLFPFELTAGQRQAIGEICTDMAQSRPMNRLLQGDVGSGKTVVAMYAMLLAVAHGHQAALMAPTEVLAQQHLRTLSMALAASKVRIGLLTGSLTPAERKELLAKIAAGEVDIVIGTHAVTHAVAKSGVEFARLGLVVIDEQHKFGVRQRAALKKAGLDPHYLVMTATPIPRTMAMTLFGDLEVSTLREPPPGRQKVYTYLANDTQRAKWWEFFRKKLDEGRQGFVIVPLVESLAATPSRAGREDDADATTDSATESRATASVQQTVEALSRGELAGYRLGMLHGRLTPSEKEAAMLAFARGQTQVLVATSVIEVGIDVSNATLMTIEGGEWFGLAQLHQLRGRVSRGSHPGYVCVFANPATDDAVQRMDAFTRTSDGFELAEIDFSLRGPGDLFGTRQHGLPPLRIADMVRDVPVLEEARPAAQALIAADPELSNLAYARLKRMVLVRYGEALDLGDVG
ncbi:MAG TPA: ATP-dependent DNA helicase RecG, partial [Pirellulaceae bacterium]|nr:ATP-dependent DNA helicase RecG [Pirellulaceae bacterium]